MKTQEIMDQNKRQKDEDEDGRQELEKMLEQKIQQLKDQTEKQREDNKDWKQNLENITLKLINQNKMDSRVSECNIKTKSKCGGRTLSREYRSSRNRRRQRESYEAWAQTLRGEFKISIKENTQVETEDKIRESQPKAVRKQTLVYPVHVQQ